MYSGFGVVAAPVEAAPEDSFDDEVVGGGGDTDADAEVDLPLGRDVEVSDGEELVLLIVGRRAVEDRAG